MPVVIRPGPVAGERLALGGDLSIEFLRRRGGCRRSRGLTKRQRAIGAGLARLCRAQCAGVLLRGDGVASRIVRIQLILESRHPRLDERLQLGQLIELLLHVAEFFDDRVILHGHCNGCRSWRRRALSRRSGSCIRSSGRGWAALPASLAGAPGAGRRRFQGCNLDQRRRLSRGDVG